MPSPVVPRILSERVFFFSKLERITAQEMGKTTFRDEMI
jgi:hypothetical protein